MKLVCSLLVLQLLVLLLSNDVNSLSLDSQDVEDKAIDKRSFASKNNSKQCGKYEHFTDCGSTCEKSCDDINNDDHLSGERCVGGAVCIEKCVCKDGHVRDKTSGGKCIRVQECPRVKH